MLVWSSLETLTDQATTSSNADFQTDVRPFLEQHCFPCHGAEKQKGGLRIDGLSADFSGGPSVNQWLELLRRRDHSAACHA